MSNPFDEALDNVGKKVEDRIKKQERKRTTKKLRTAEFTGPDGMSEGEATVETCEDGKRHFVEISVDIPFAGRKTVVSVDDDSLAGALAKAEEAFKEIDYGSISLERLADDE
jgi:hypothetical protein